MTTILTVWDKKAVEDLLEFVKQIYGTLDDDPKKLHFTINLPWGYNAYRAVQELYDRWLKDI